MRDFGQLNSLAEKYGDKLVHHSSPHAIPRPFPSTIALAMPKAIAIGIAVQPTGTLCGICGETPYQCVVLCLCNISRDAKCTSCPVPLTAGFA